MSAPKQDSSGIRAEGAAMNRLLVASQLGDPVKMAFAERLPDAEVPRVKQLGNPRVLFERSDYIVLAAAATSETFHLVMRELLAYAKPELHLINIARSTLIDDGTLLDALDNRHVALASLDVTDPEPLAAGHAFYTHPPVCVSPHISVHTPGAPLEGVVDLTRGY
jgi:phosphoglycerate dehydrogenase-like enzyme